MNPRLKSALRWVAGPQLERLRAFRVRMGERSWSQEGEDRMLLRYFDYRSSGFYVDVGAHHPFRFSNTALLHAMGWRGINIDAMPGSMQAFRRDRPNDVNLEVGISDVPGTAKFYVFNEKALNTFDAVMAHERVGPQWHIESTIDVLLRPLRDVLDQYLVAGQTIDLMTVDAEGHDLTVLASNDWTRFRPQVVLAESLGLTIDALQHDPCARLLKDAGYAAFGKTVNTVMYVDDCRDDQAPGVMQAKSE